jgi:hypothetical protein
MWNPDDPNDPENAGYKQVSPDAAPDTSGGDDPMASITPAAGVPSATQTPAESQKGITPEELRAKLNDNVYLPNGTPNMLSTGMFNQLTKHAFNEAKLGNIDMDTAMHIATSLGQARQAQIQNLVTLGTSITDLAKKDVDVDKAKIETTNLVKDAQLNQAQIVVNAFDDPKGGPAAALAAYNLIQSSATSPAMKMPQMDVTSEATINKLRGLAKGSDLYLKQATNNSEVAQRNSLTTGQNQKNVAAQKNFTGDVDQGSTVQPEVGTRTPDPGYKADQLAISGIAKATDVAQTHLNNMFDANPKAPSSMLGNNVGAFIGNLTSFHNDLATNKNTMVAGARNILPLIEAIGVRDPGKAATLRGLLATTQDFSTASADDRDKAMRSIQQFLDETKAQGAVAATARSQKPNDVDRAAAVGVTWHVTRCSKRADAEPSAPTTIRCEIR